MLERGTLKQAFAGLKQGLNSALEGAAQVSRRAQAHCSSRVQYPRAAPTRCAVPCLGHEHSNKH